MSEKNPLNYGFGQHCRCFNSVLMVSSTPLHLRSKIKKLLTHLVSLKVISYNLAEKAWTQYSELLTTFTQDHLKNAKAFDYKESRLDDFSMQKSTLKIPNELKSILTLVLVITHGQASVLRGFDTNKSISKVNLSEKSMVSICKCVNGVKKTVRYQRLLSSPTRLLRL